MNTLTFTDLYTRYVKYREVSGLSMLTLASLKTFYYYCCREYPDDPYLTEDKISRWAEKHPNETNSTRNGRIGCLNDFIRYLNKRDLAKLPEIPLLKGDRIVRDPILFSKAELDNFFKATTELKVNRSFGMVHDCQVIDKIEVPVIFRLLYSTGMRPCEVRNLRTEDVDLENQIITIQRTKGYAERKIVVHASVIDMLRGYEKRISRVIRKRTYYFPRVDGHSPQSVQWLCTHFKIAWKKYNTSDVIPYSFRHNYAVENINAMPKTGYEITPELIALSKSMGHTNLTSTLYYYHLTPQFAELYSDILGETINQLLPEI